MSKSQAVATFLHIPVSPSAFSLSVPSGSSHLLPPPLHHLAHLQPLCLSVLTCQSSTLLPRSFFSVVTFFSHKSLGTGVAKCEGWGKPGGKSGRLIRCCGAELGGLEGEESVWIISD